MAAVAAVGFGRAREALPERDRRNLAWTSMGVGLAIAVAGSVGQSPVLIGLGAVIIGALGAVLAPQLLLAAFLVAGGLKEAPFLSGVPADLTLLTAAGVIVAMIVRASKPDGIPPFPPAAVLGVGVAAIVVLSVLWSPAPDLGLEKALRFESLTMIAFFAPLVLVRTREDLTRLMIFLVVMSLAVALTAVPGEDPNQPLTVAGGKSEIELALYASSGIVAAIYLALVSRLPWRILWFVPAVVLANTVIAAGSRGVLIGTGLALAVMGVQIVIRSRVKVLPLAVIAGVVIVIVAFGAQIAGPAAGAKYEGLFGGDAPQTLGKRNFLIQDGIDLALEYPLGAGASAYEARTGFGYPHNMLVEISAEQGIIGLVLLVALILVAFRYAFRSREGPFGPESILAVGLLVVLVADAMVSQTFTQFRELWFAFGLALAMPYIATRAKPRPARL